MRVDQETLRTGAARWWDDVRIALVWLTRLPVRVDHERSVARAAQAAWAYPLVGVVVGAIAAGVYLGLTALGVAPLAAALLAVGAGAVATGVLHEDGFADVADGFGGGSDRAKTLEIMKDSRIGAFGTVAMILSFGARAGALATLGPWDGAAALIVAAILSRGALAGAMATLAPARSEGLAAMVGRPGRSTALFGVAVAMALALGVALLAGPPIGVDAMLLSAAMAAVAAAAMGWLAQRQIGGATGDVYGAAQQAAEIAVLLTLAAR